MEFGNKNLINSTLNEGLRGENFLLNSGLRFDSSANIFSNNDTNILEQIDTLDLVSSVADSMTAVTPPALLNTDENTTNQRSSSYNNLIERNILQINSNESSKILSQPQVILN